MEEVTRETQDEWSAFLVAMYDLPGVEPALHALVERRGWRHYALRDGEEVSAARSMYIHDDGVAWWGVEAPVPGLMTPRFDLDLHLCREMVGDGLKMGVKLFVADIETPSERMDHDGYRNFGELGFERAYFRSNYGY